MEVKLVVIGGKHAGTAIPIPGPKFLIGRGEGCHFRPQSHLVSRKHCAIVVQEGSVTIEDAGSTNGTFVNDERVQQQRELKSGDRIKVGGFELEVELSATLEGKKKPKVNNVQEAAARTVAASVSPEGELDVSGWLADEEAEQKPASPSPKAAARAGHVCGQGHRRHDNHAGQPGPPEKEKDKQKPRPKPGSTSLRAAKPMADSSRTAAEDVLRHSFPAGKPELHRETTVKAANHVRKSAALLGLAFDNDDGHTRLTRGKNFFLLGGCQETHAVMQETAVKVNEHLDKRGQRLEDVSPGELGRICRDVVESIRPS